MIAYQLVLTVAGFFHSLRSAKEKREVDALDASTCPECGADPGAQRGEGDPPHPGGDAGVRLPAPTGYEVHRHQRRLHRRHRRHRRGVRRAATGVSASSTCRPARGARASRAPSTSALRTPTPAFIAVYDADNTPEPSALRYLVAQLLLHPELGAVLGKFRTVNKRHQPADALHQRRDALVPVDRAGRALEAVPVSPRCPAPTTSSAARSSTTSAAGTRAPSPRTPRCRSGSTWRGSGSR